MTVPSSSILQRKSEVVTNTSVNGGKRGRAQVVHALRHGIFPRLPGAFLASGGEILRKIFFSNEDPDDETAADVLVWLRSQSTAGDRIGLGLGSADDVQGDLASSPPVWCGCGRIAVALVGGETEVQLAMEADDFEFPNGGLLCLSSTYKSGQTVAADARAGDSVAWNSGESRWDKSTLSTSVEFPDGIFLGSGLVLTDDSDHQEWLRIADNLREAEQIGTGDGALQNPALTDLAQAGNGVCAQPGKLPVVTATCGGVERTVEIAADGTCSGYCTAGELDMATGEWTTDITWSTAPDNATAIEIDYRELCYTYSGLTATVELAEQVANPYSTDEGHGAPCVEGGDLACSVEDWTETSTAGTYDETGNPLALYNDGTEDEAWTLTFTGATAFTCAGAVLGSVGTGSVSEDFAPVNPETGQPYFSLAAAGWAGTWAAGETVTFHTLPAALGIWLRQTVPAGTSPAQDNALVYGYSWE